MTMYSNHALGNYMSLSEPSHILHHTASRTKSQAFTSWMHQSWVLPYQSQCHGFGSVPQCRHSCKELESEPAKGLHLEKTLSSLYSHLHEVSGHYSYSMWSSPKWFFTMVAMNSAGHCIYQPSSWLDTCRRGQMKHCTIVVHHFNLLTSYTWQRQGPGHTCLK